MIRRPWIKQTQEDVDMAIREAHWRNDHKQRMGVRSNKRVERYSELDANIRGIKGEIAGHKFARIPFKERGTDPLRGDGGKNDLPFTGGSVGIKTPQVYLGPFGGFWTDKSKFKDDFGMLVYPYTRDEDGHLIYGFITQKQWHEHAYQRDFGLGLHWVCNADKFEHPLILMPGGRDDWEPYKQDAEDVPPKIQQLSLWGEEVLPCRNVPPMLHGKTR